MLFSDQLSHFSPFISVFHHLMKGGQDDGVAVNPWSSQQQIVRHVSINEIICHLIFQVPNLASELDFSHLVHTIGVETINGSLSSAQSVDRDS